MKPWRRTIGGGTSLMSVLLSIAYANGGWAGVADGALILFWAVGFLVSIFVFAGGLVDLFNKPKDKE